ncbi:hypothetical protein KC722_02845 [Candidatus Kaiserbacteria bacterium]|nr:hypothetical protein [Candidatus Kaiserbacteria bacterium]MCB9811374.1 hypothetical protein [Candidatus Nomurabacteria bacterium]
MKKITLLALVVVAVAFSAMVATAQPGDSLYWMKAYVTGTQSYVASIDDELDQLETELAAVEAGIADGTLTPAEAVAAKEHIVSRMNSIQGAVSGADNAKLTPAQKAQLSAALDRLTTILVTYKDSITTVDTIATAEEKKRSGGSSKKSIADVVTDTVGTLEDHVEEVTGEEQDASDVIEDEFMAEEEEMSDDNATSTDDGTDGSMSDDDMSDDTMGGDDTMSDDTSTSTNDGTDDTSDMDDDSNTGETTDNSTGEDEPVE